MSQTARVRKISVLGGEAKTAAQRTDLNKPEREVVKYAGFQLPPQHAHFNELFANIERPNDVKSEGPEPANPKDVAINTLYSDYIHMPNVFKPHFSVSGNTQKKYTDFKQMHFHLELTKLDLAVHDPNEESKLEAYIFLYNNQMKSAITREWYLPMDADGSCKGSSRNTIFIDLMPPDMGDMHVVVRVYRVGGLNIEKKGKSKHLKAMRRPLCVATLPVPVTKLNESLTTGEQIKMKMYVKTYEIVEKHEKDFHTIQDNVIRQVAGMEELKQNMDCGGISYAFQLYNGTVDSIPEQMKESQRQKVELLNFVPKVEFPYLRPAETRNYVLVKLTKALLAKKGNVMIEIELRNQNYETIPHSIARGFGDDAKMKSKYRSTVFVKTNAPNWEETIRVLLPPMGQWNGLHLFFMLSHITNSKQEAFAFGFQRLQGDQLVTVLDNRSYDITCYKYSNKDDWKNKGYFSKFVEDPTWADDRKTDDKLFISTTLCSSMASQDDTVAQALNWQALADHLLSNYLRRVGKKNIIDVFDLAPMIFKTLFSILSSRQYGKPTHTIHQLALSAFLSLLTKAVKETQFNSSRSIRSLKKKPTEKKKMMPRGRAATVAVQSNRAKPGEDGEETSKVALRMIDYYILPDFLGLLENFLDKSFSQTLVYNAVLPLFGRLFFFAESEEARDSDKIEMNPMYADLNAAANTAGWLFRLLFRSYQIGIRGKKAKEGEDLYAGLKEDLDKLLVLLHSIVAAEEPAWLHSYMKGPLLYQFLQIYEICLKEELFDLERIKSMVEIVVINSEKGCDQSQEYCRARLQFLIHLVEYLSKPTAGAEVNNERQSKYEQQNNCLDQNLLQLPMFKPVLGAMWDAVGFHIQDDRSTNEKFLACRLISALLPATFHAVEETRAQVEANGGNPKEMNNDVALALNVLTPLSYFQHDLLKAEAAGQLDNVLKRMDQDILEDSPNPLGEVTLAFLSVISPPLLNKQRFDQLLHTVRTFGKDKERDWLLFLFEILVHLSQNTVYPRYWIMMRMTELTACYNFICWSATHLVRYYLSSETFFLPLWSGFTLLVCEFLLSSSLDAGSSGVTEEASNFITTYYTDLRVPVCHLFQMCWYYLGDHQLAFVDVVVARLIELGQVHEQKVASIGRALYFQLFVKEYKMKGNVKNFLFYTIDTVGKLASQYSGNQLDSYMDFFRVHLKVAIESSDSDIAGAGAKFLDDIESLFDRLVELESLPQEAKYETERSLRGVRLLQYLKERGKMDLYRKYTFYLCQMHADLDNKVEFANAVLLIANDMEWNEENQTPFQDNVFNFPAQTSTQRKISMYQRAIAAFDAAQNWEASVQVCKDLAEAYEYVIFNHHLLIETHNKISNYWQSILNTDRIFNSYYRVAFYGAGYAHMKCTEFVYKSGAGLVLESVRDFTMRIKAKFPDAHVENSSDLPKDKWLPGGEEEKDRYIQITTLNCSNREQLEGKTPWYLTTGLPGNVMKYYENSETDVWTFTRVDKTRKAKKGENEYRSLWVYRMYIIGQLELPSYSRCIEVVERKEVLICPLENAVNVLNEKNMEMKQIIKRIKTKASTFHGDDKENPVSTQLGPLSMNLSGVIDAAVMGGVEKYREAFFDGSYVKEFPSHAHYIPKFRQAMKDQVEILKSGLDVFGRYCQESLLPLSDHLTGTYRKMKNSLQWMDEVDVSGLEVKTKN